MSWQKVTLVGLGLLGGSLGLALRSRNLARRVEAYVRRPAAIKEAHQSGAVDAATCDLHAAVSGAELVVLCTPIAQMAALARELMPSLAPGALLTDVGSVKDPVVRELEPMAARAGVRFVGSHPMAGKEKTGVAAAEAGLFKNAICVITPTERSSPEAVSSIETLWREVGGVPLRMEAGLHDQLVSRSSHLPHVVAAELANFVLNPAFGEKQALLCANGFKDTTRIASGSPEMWRDIALANRENLSASIGVFISDLQAFRAALEQGDDQRIADFFENGRRLREAMLASRSASPTPE